MQIFTRVVLAFFTLAVISGCSISNAAKAKTLRIGYQKWGTFSILKVSAQLEAALVSKGVAVTWIEFPAGPPLLEALNAGSIDIGHTGDSPPLFAQAAGAPLVYVAVTPPSPESSGLLVRADSPIKSVADLKGKRIAFTKGTSAHTFVLRILEKNSLTLSDIEPVYLTPADGRAALASKSVDAWSIWDPYFAAAEQDGSARSIANGKGVVAGREFYLASSNFVNTAPEILSTVLSSLRKAGDWAEKHNAEVHALLSKETGISQGAIDLAESRRIRYALVPVTDDIVAEQQDLADRYLELKLLPKHISVKEAVNPNALGAAQ